MQFKACLLWFLLLPDAALSLCSMDSGTFTPAHFKELKDEKQVAFTSWATVGYMFQVGTMYVMSTFLKRWEPIVDDVTC